MLDFASRSILNVDFSEKTGLNIQKVKKNDTIKLIS